MPVWEEDSNRIDGKTHIIVELDNPKFNLKEIYTEFRSLFCIDNSEEIFEKSPFLFMHRIKAVHVKKIDEYGYDEFITEYLEKSEKIVYSKPFKLNKKKKILAGVAHNEIYYKEQFQEGVIRATSKNGKKHQKRINYILINIYIPI